ncbi:MAG: hypothetical protein Aurels2KO_56940 [Aureliella sp.]
MQVRFLSALLVTHKGLTLIERKSFFCFPILLGTNWEHHGIYVGVISLAALRIPADNLSMATLEKRGKMYRIIFRFGGERFTRSLNTDRESAARLALAQVEENIRNVELGLLSIEEGDDVPSVLLSSGERKRKAKPTAMRSPTVFSILDQYVGAIPQNSIEANSLDMLRTHIRNLQRHLGKRLKPESVVLSTLQDFINARSREAGSRAGTLISPVTIRKELTTLSAAWDWALESKLVSHPMPNKRRLRYPKADEKPPFKTWDEIERVSLRNQLSKAEQRAHWDCLFLDGSQIEQLLVDLPPSPIRFLIHPMIAFAAYTGARRSELLRSELQDIDLEASMVVIREKKRVRGQTSTRAVPVSPQLRPILADWLKSHPGGSHTFTVSGASITAQQAHHYFRRAIRSTKWEVLRGWHVLRHSFISSCASKGVDQRMIDDWVGHQTDAMRKRYRHLFPNVQQQAISDVFS